MNAHTSRRALALASALVAAGLALASAPHALASDDAGTAAMTLTGDQAQTLADHVNVDVYGDDNPYAAKDDGSSTDSSSTDATPGTAATAAPVTFTGTSTLEGVRGVAATVPAGSDGSYFTVHALGNVQLHKADGSTAWARTNTSLYADWRVKPLRAYQAEPYPARIVMGYNAVSPFTPGSDQGYDTADLTGDGTPDLVFSASVGTSPYRPFASPGSSLPTGTFVTVLDGRTGTTLWSKLYPAATMVKVVDGTLLIADAPRVNQNAAKTDTATLTGIRFSYADGALTPATTWTYDTGTTAAATWGALESVGGGRVAAVWDLRKTATTAARGRTLVLDTADGSVVWQTDSTLYGRQLRLDASRDRIVAVEQADTSDAVTYEIAAYDLGSGERATLDTRVNALPTALMVGDAATGGGAEYVVAESTFTSSFYVNAGTIRVLDGSDGATARWTHTTKRDAANSGDGPSTWNLAVQGGSLIAAAQDDTGLGTADNPGGLRYGSLTAFTGGGKVKWRRDGLDASPMYQQVYSAGGGDYVRVVDQRQNVREYSLGNGAQKRLTPLQGDLNDGRAADFDGDGRKDVVVGGSSNGVWAYSGPSLVEGEPRKLWQAAVPGEVHDIATGDLNGDGTPDVAVAADTATALLDGRTGKTLATVDGKGAYVRSVTVADVNGDGRSEVLVPTDALRVYDASGTQLWSYSAPSDAGEVVFSDTVVEDGRVHTQYTTLGAFDSSDAVVNGVALDAAKGTVLWTADPVAPARAADGRLHGAVLDHGVFASPDIPYADGHAVVHTWIIKADPTTAGDVSTATPRVVIEIRDGRTGEVLHRFIGGSPFSHGNYFVDGRNDPLYQLSFGVFNGFAAGGAETRSSVTLPLRSAQFVDGPGGRRLVAGGTEAGLAAYDPSVLTTGWSFQSSIGGATLMGGREYVAADLDGDGADEMVSLNFDHFGVNRAAALLGGGVLSLDNAIHQMTVFKLS